MDNILFLQSEISDPFQVYAHKLRESPVHYDKQNQIWGVYKFSDCLSVLTDETALIPPVVHNENLLSPGTVRIMNGLARLANPPLHHGRRAVASRLMRMCVIQDVPELLHQLIGEPRRPVIMNWVETVCAKLPVYSILKNLPLTNREVMNISHHVATLTKMMTPITDLTSANQLNTATFEVYPVLKKAMKRMDFEHHELELCISNLIGLLIQSFDAGRGLLSNVLLRLIQTPNAEYHTINLLVKESLRFDPPVHNTRRVLLNETTLHGYILKPGEHVLVVVAAANRDPDQFKDPNSFQLNRLATIPYLSFGYGLHQCVAEGYITDLTTKTIQYLISKYPTIQLMDSKIEYEPRVNVRLPRKMILKLA
jgi:hypothetical protein